MDVNGAAAGSHDNTPIAFLHKTAESLCAVDDSYFIASRLSTGKRPVKIIRGIEPNYAGLPSDDESDLDFCPVNSDAEDDDSSGGSSGQEESESSDSEESGSESSLEGSEQDLSLEEGFPESKRNQQLAPEHICSLCLNFRKIAGSYIADDFIQCDLCGVTFHESCYGLTDPPNYSALSKEERQILSSREEEPWACERCTYHQKCPPFCELCPVRGGVYKPLANGKAWVHLLCALYTDDCTFGDLGRLTPVSLCEVNPDLFGARSCSLCSSDSDARTGIAVKCEAGLCKQHFHATCAQRKGFLGESEMPTHGGNAEPLLAFCQAHTDKTVVTRRKQRYKIMIKQEKTFESPLTDIERTALVKAYRSDTSENGAPCRQNDSPKAKRPRLMHTCAEMVHKMALKSEHLSDGDRPGSGSKHVVADKKLHSGDHPGLSQETVKACIGSVGKMPPAFTSEFITYIKERENAICDLATQMDRLDYDIQSAKQEETALSQEYEQLKFYDTREKLARELLPKLNSVRKIFNAVSLECPIITTLTSPSAQFKKHAGAQIRNASLPSSDNKGTISIEECAKCSSMKDQHCLVLCDSCKKHFHIYCLDPPLDKVPKKSANFTWECSSCFEDSGTDSDPNAHVDAPRSLRKKTVASALPSRLTQSAKTPRNRKKAQKLSKSSVSRRQKKVAVHAN